LPLPGTETRTRAPGTLWIGKKKKKKIEKDWISETLVFYHNTTQHKTTQLGVITQKTSTRNIAVKASKLAHSSCGLLDCDVFSVKMDAA
jgi:hypothetical protein